jgi:hypothetical protein
MGAKIAFLIDFWGIYANIQIHAIFVGSWITGNLQNIGNKKSPQR